VRHRYDRSRYVVRDDELGGDAYHWPRVFPDWDSPRLRRYPRDLVMADLYIDSIDVCRRLAAACKSAGSQKAFAEKNNLSPAYVCDVLNSRREPGQSILDALGLVRIVRYRARATNVKKGAE
jgi:hypothetical protein